MKPRYERVELYAKWIMHNNFRPERVPAELRTDVLARVEQMKAEAWARSDAGKNSANIDYIAMMTGVDLPEDDE